MKIILRHATINDQEILEYWDKHQHNMESDPNAVYFIGRKEWETHLKL
ncbi:MAG: hypothetical protein IPI60_08840 [Saprospiraceae bacterium]|nr:hypothetical protein [Saprospiraceae bacterium]